MFSKATHGLASLQPSRSRKWRRESHPPISELEDLVLETVQVLTAAGQGSVSWRDLRDIGCGSTEPRLREALNNLANRGALVKTAGPSYKKRVCFTLP